MISVARPLTTDAKGRELVEHGTALFPLECYQEEVGLYPVPWHWHEDWEIVQNTRGQVRIAVPAEILTLEEGEALFLGPNVIHEIAGDGPDSQIISVVFHPRFISSMDSLIWQKYIAPVLQRESAVLLQKSAGWQAACIACFEDCWQAVAKEPPGYEFTAREALSSFVFQMYSHMEPRQQALSSREMRDTGRIRAMMGFIHANYRERLTIAQIAAAAAVSPSECLRCFHHTINTSPGQYLKDFRLQKAAELLLTTDEKAAEIGAACGIPDAAYFTKLFRESKGCTPGEYRNSRKKKEG